VIPLNHRLEEGDGLDAGDVEALAAADVLAAEDVVGADHVALGLGEAGTVALVCIAGELGFLAADEPADLVLAGLPAVRAGHGVGALLGAFVEKVSFFHTGGSLCRIRGFTGSGRESWTCCLREKYCIIVAAAQGEGTAMGKAKKRVFSIVKAVKQNARDRVGAVPSGRVIPDPKQKAAAKPKHKKTLADLLSGEDGG